MTLINYSVIIHKENNNFLFLQYCATTFIHLRFQHIFVGPSTLFTFKLLQVALSATGQYTTINSRHNNQKFQMVVIEVWFNRLYQTHTSLQQSVVINHSLNPTKFRNKSNKKLTSAATISHVNKPWSPVYSGEHIAID